MKIIPYLTKYKKLVICGIIFSLIISLVVAFSFKPKYEVYTYFELKKGVPFQLLTDSRLLKDREGDFGVDKVSRDRGNKIYKAYHTGSTLSKTEKEFKSWLRDYVRWQPRTIRISQIRNKTVYPSRRKNFILSLFTLIGLLVGGIMAWEHRIPIFYEDDDEYDEGERRITVSLNLNKEQKEVLAKAIEKQ